MMSFFTIIVLAVWSTFSIVQGNMIWPQVAESKFGQNTVTISRSLEFDSPQVKTLTAAYERYKLIMFPHATEQGKADSSVNTITVVKVEVENVSEEYPQLETDESYELLISTDGESTISAKTVYGVLRALESLSQLVLFDYDEEQYLISNSPVSIKDMPRYPHRGLLLDTSRHFQPLSEIERTIDALSYAKYNGKINNSVVSILSTVIISTSLLSSVGRMSLTSTIHLRFEC